MRNVRVHTMNTSGCYRKDRRYYQVLKGGDDYVIYADTSR